MALSGQGMVNAELEEFLDSDSSPSYLLLKDYITALQQLFNRPRVSVSSRSNLVFR